MKKTNIKLYILSGFLALGLICPAIAQSNKLPDLERFYQPQVCTQKIVEPGRAEIHLCHEDTQVILDWSSPSGFDGIQVDENWDGARGTIYPHKTVVWSYGSLVRRVNYLVPNLLPYTLGAHENLWTSIQNQAPKLARGVPLMNIPYGGENGWVQMISINTGKGSETVLMLSDVAWHGDLLVRAFVKWKNLPAPQIITHYKSLLRFLQANAIFLPHPDVLFKTGKCGEDPRIKTLLFDPGSPINMSEFPSKTAPHIIFDRCPANLADLSIIGFIVDRKIGPPHAFYPGTEDMPLGEKISTSARLYGISPMCGIDSGFADNHGSAWCLRSDGRVSLQKILPNQYVRVY